MMRNPNSLFAVSMMMICTSGLFAQTTVPTARVSGTVEDANGNPLAFANVYFEETMEGAMSDAEGRFSFTSRAADVVTLVCAYIGYETFRKSIEVAPGKSQTFRIVMRSDVVKGRAVVVTASAFTAADEEGVTLTAMDVVRTPGAAADVFWAVKSFPGIQQVEEGAGLFVRGGDVSETVVFLDGAVIDHPYKYESPTGGFFGTFSPFLLKGTYFSSGGFSAEYGNALSGALAMESQDMPEKRAVGLGVGLAAESVYLAVPVVRDKLGFSMSGNLSNTRMMFELNGSKKDFSAYPSSLDINVNAVYKPGKNTQVKVFVFREDDEVGVEVDDPDYDTHFHGDSSNRLYNLRIKTLLGGMLLLQWNAALSRFKRGIVMGVMDLDLEDRLLQTRLVAERSYGRRLTVRAGLAYFRNETLISGIVPQEELDVSPGAPIDVVDTDYASDRVVQFAECEFFGPGGLQVLPGVRAEYESVSEEYHIDPRVTVNYPLTDHSNLTAAWGRFRQYPGPEYFDPYVGNPLLSSMRAMHAILGYAYQRDSRLFRLEGYYKTYDGLLLEDDAVNYTNEGEGYAYGADVFLKDSFGRFSGWVAYSWLRARRKWMDLPVLASPYFDITHNLTAVLNIDLPYHLSMGFSFRYATGKPYTSAPDLVHDSRVPDYLKTDFSFSYLHSFFPSNLTVFYLGVSNLFGRINIFDYKYSDDWQRRDAVESSFARSVYFGVSFNM